MLLNHDGKFCQPWICFFVNPSCVIWVFTLVNAINPWWEVLSTVNVFLLKPIFCHFSFSQWWMLLNHGGNFFKHGCVPLKTNSMVLQFSTNGKYCQNHDGKFFHIDVMLINSIMLNLLRYLHRQIFNILFCPQNLSTVSSDDVICISGVLFWIYLRI